MPSYRFWIYLCPVYLYTISFFKQFTLWDINVCLKKTWNPYHKGKPELNVINRKECLKIHHRHHHKLKQCYQILAGCCCLPCCLDPDGDSKVDLLPLRLSPWDHQNGWEWIGKWIATSLGDSIACPLPRPHSQSPNHPDQVPLGHFLTPGRLTWPREDTPTLVPPCVKQGVWLENNC